LLENPKFATESTQTPPRELTIKKNFRHFVPPNFELALMPLPSVLWWCWLGESQIVWDIGLTAVDGMGYCHEQPTWRAPWHSWLRTAV